MIWEYLAQSVCMGAPAPRAIPHAAPPLERKFAPEPGIGANSGRKCYCFSVIIDQSLTFSGARDRFAHNLPPRRSRGESEHCSRVLRGPKCPDWRIKCQKILSENSQFILRKLRDYAVGAHFLWAGSLSKVPGF